MAEERDPRLFELSLLAQAFSQIGDLDYARRTFDLAGAGDESAISNSEVQFWMHMAVKEYDAAMRYLERAIDDNFPVSLVATLHFYPNHPTFDPIRSHPKFDGLVQRAGTPIGSAK